MSTWRYRDEARRHVWEFTDLGYAREDDRKVLYENVLADHKKIEAYLGSYSNVIWELVRATPSRREAMLRRLTDGDSLTQMVLILGAWQHCRKAVLAYDWLIENDRHFVPGDPYRVATAMQGRLFDQLRARKWTRWPFQWGKSPFPGEKTRRDPEDAPDYDQVIDDYDPRTGMY
ncbi:hypothetical protein [Hydrogenophaga sp.]|uniref:hypothetical protein n=1 Tax=Hydrogenophaga sp. TaxID=1904254 RepID=UPI00271BC01D|nr:hypothetical protein [Hydrogenophaga sp.]MDO9134013.1 hypothetical protein [Hydrogenophaga sp.]